MFISNQNTGYYLYDFGEECPIAYADTWQELISLWLKYAGSSFQELNVTGKDIYRDSREYYGEDGVLYEDAEYYLRRYQVLDKQERSIDIRDWFKSAWEHGYRYRSKLGGTQWQHDDRHPGRKRKRRPASGPSFYRGARRAAEQSYIDYEELEELGLPIPAQDRCSPRKKSIMSEGDAWGFYEKVHHKHRACSKCWKDQRKVYRQAKGYTRPVEYPVIED